MLGSKITSHGRDRSMKTIPTLTGGVLVVFASTISASASELDPAGSHPRPDYSGYSDAQIQAMGTVEFLATRWRMTYECYRSATRQLPNSRMVFYERLVENELTVLNNVCRELGIEDCLPTSEMERLRSTDGADRRDSRIPFFSVFRPGGVDAQRWKSTMTEDQIARVLQSARFDEISDQWEQ